MQRLILPGLVLVFSFFSLFIGASPLSMNALHETTLHLLIHSRFPRTLSLLVSGMSLATAGAIMQLLTANRFVTPTTGSTTEWAKLGLLITLLWFPQAGVPTKTLFTFLFAFGGTLSFLFILRKIQIKEAAIVPLIGIIYGNIISSVTLYLGYQHDLIQSVQSWVQGNFALVLKGRYEVLFLSIPCLVLAVVYANRFTVISMGKDISHTLGIRYTTTLQVGLIIVSVISSLVLVTVGVIPFVGLVIPNIVSLFKGDNLEKNILVIAFSGGLFLLICDIISRVVIHPFEIPISVTAAVAGCILFITFLLYRRRHAA